MDLGALIGESWRVVRQARALWGLGLVSAIQAGLYGFVIAGLILPMTLLTQLLVVQAATGAAGAAVPAPLSAYLPAILGWLPSHRGLLVAFVLGVTAIWAVFGVADVAATAGAIAETARFERGEPISTADGMRAGFAVWWRTVGLLAIAALPSLVYLLAIAIFTLVTISIPLAAGRLPDVRLIGLGNGANSFISGIVGLIGIPLGVLVQLGLRAGVLEGRAWRQALSSAWRLVRAHFAEVALVYVAQLGIALASVLVTGVAVGAIALVVGVAVVAATASGMASSGGIVLAGVVLGVLALVAGSAISAVLFVWTSALWTLAWLRLTAAEPAGRLASPAGEIGRAAS